MTYQAIPDKEVRIIPALGNENAPFHQYVKRAAVVREWFDPHVYKCLPLAIANQYGFILHAPFDFTYYWDGGVNPDSVHITVDRMTIDPESELMVKVKSTFGRGILTVYPGFVLKTPENINLWIKQPPNHIKEGVSWLEGVVETDNLNSTFSFNLKPHAPHQKIQFKKGEPIGSFIPFPRFFFDDYQLNVSQNEEEILYYGKKQSVFGLVRNNFMENGLYRSGSDFDGCPFHNHQKVVTKPTSKGVTDHDNS